MFRPFKYEVLDATVMSVVEVSGNQELMTIRANRSSTPPSVCLLTMLVAAEYEEVGYMACSMHD